MIGSHSPSKEKRRPCLLLGKEDGLLHLQMTKSHGEMGGVGWGSNWYISSRSGWVMCIPSGTPQTIFCQEGWQMGFRRNWSFALSSFYKVQSHKLKKKNLLVSTGPRGHKYFPFWFGNKRWREITSGRRKAGILRHSRARVCFLTKKASR